MTRRFPVPIAAALGLCVALFLLTAPARAETPDSTDPADPQSQTTTTVSVTGTAPPGPPLAIIKFGDNTLRIGTVLQPTFDGTQDVNSSGYSQNFYMRRARFFMLGKLGKKVGEGVSEVEFFFQVDNPREGNSAPPAGPKNTGTTGFLIQDAYVQWAFGCNAIALQAGEWIVPTIRQVHTSVATFMALDLPTWGLQQNTVLQGNGGRDYGVGFNGYLLDDHFSYRVGVFSGLRQGTTNQAPPLGAEACCRNSPRFAGRFMYDFFDAEKGYTYQGTYRGTKKVVAIAAVADVQGSYEGFGGDAYVSWPIGPDAITAEVDYLHYSGWGKVYGAIPQQYTVYGDAGYFIGAFQLEPFVRYEVLTFAAPINKAKEQSRVGGGFNYYVMGQNFKITPYYERVMPKVEPLTAKIKDFNRFVVQIQTSL
jgi:Phosphate-selective porin O and P